MKHKTVNVILEGHIAKVELNRPEMANALNEQSWHELKEAFVFLDKKVEVRVVVLYGKGKNFCSGIDLSMFQLIMQNQEKCAGRSMERLLYIIKDLQESITSIEKCRKPVIAVIQGACIGAGLDLIAACDMRYSADDAFFSIKEVDMGIVADLGSLQRLPKILSEGTIRELAYTGRKVQAQEATTLGIVNNSFKDQETLNAAVQSIAETISSKSPLAIRGIKANMNFSRDHTVEEGLAHVASWNAAMILSNDIKEILLAKQENRQPKFKD